MMRICLLGGIFGKPAGYRAAVTNTPETVLAAGLRERGHAVETFGLTRSPGDLSRFDIVHAHHLARGTVGAAAQRRRGALVFTSHASAQPSISRRLAQRYVLARADAMVVLSQTEAERTRRAFPRLAAKQHVIANGVDAENFAYVPPPRPPRGGEPWKLLFVGQLTPLKGVHYLLPALAALHGRVSVELRLAYHVDTEKTALEAQAGQLGLTRIRFLGIQSPQQLARLYAESHVLVLPSTIEAMPQVIAEALLVGRPVVGTDVGAVREQVAGRGRVIAPRDAAALANAIEHVCRGYDGFAAQAHAASTAARARYSIESMITAHEGLYRGLVQVRPSSRGGDEAVDWPVRRVLWGLDHFGPRAAHRTEARAERAQRGAGQK
jgi:glycosyltransferase involved in cell wall biosynthesis